MTEKYQYKTINPFKISKFTERSKTRLFSSMSNIYGIESPGEKLKSGKFYSGKFRGNFQN